jgi:hypothetical protein
VVQILALVLVVALVFWLVRRARKRSQSRDEHAPQPSSVAPIAAKVETAESDHEVPELVAESNGADPEPTELEAELKEIYDKVGEPDSFGEAKEKVTALAADLVERDGIDMNEALRIAYLRSLVEHREYLAAKGLA